MFVENIKVFNFENALRGMRNPKDSWSISDTIYIKPDSCNDEELKQKLFENKNILPVSEYIDDKCNEKIFYKTEDSTILSEIANNRYIFKHKPFDLESTVYQYVDTDCIAIVGPNDLKLAKKLSKNGPVHRKYLREILVSMDIIGSLDFWKEWDTMKVGTVSNSCSTMHKITSKPITDPMFSNADLRPYDIEKRKEWIKYLNEVRDDNSLSDIEKTRILSKQLLLGFEQRRTLTFNYETLANAFPWRKNHKLKEWRWLCNEIFINLPYFKDFVVSMLNAKPTIDKKTVEKILSMAGCDNNIDIETILKEINK